MYSYSVAFEMKETKGSVGKIGLYCDEKKAIIYLDVIPCGYESFGYEVCEYKNDDGTVFESGDRGYADIYGHRVGASVEDEYLYVEVIE